MVCGLQAAPGQWACVCVRAAWVMYRFGVVPGVRRRFGAHFGCGACVARCYFLVGVSKGDQPLCGSHPTDFMDLITSTWTLLGRSWERTPHLVGCFQGRPFGRDGGRVARYWVGPPRGPWIPWVTGRVSLRPNLVQYTARLCSSACVEHAVKHVMDVLKLVWTCAASVGLPLERCGAWMAMLDLKRLDRMAWECLLAYPWEPMIHG